MLAIVVPCPPAHVVLLVIVFRFITDVPAPPVAERGVQPVNTDFRTGTPPITTGVADTSRAHCAADPADAAGMAAGMTISEQPAIEIAIRPNGYRRRIQFPLETLP